MELIVYEFDATISKILNEYDTDMLYESVIFMEDDTTPVVTDNSDEGVDDDYDDDDSENNEGNNPTVSDNSSNTQNQNDKAKKESFITKIINAIKSFFQKIKDFITGKYKDGNIDERIKLIGEKLKENPELRDKQIEVPFFNKAEFKSTYDKYMKEIKNGKKYTNEELSKIYFDSTKKVTTTVGEAFDYVVKNLKNRDADMNNALNIITNALNGNDEMSREEASASSALANGYAQSKGGSLNILASISKYFKIGTAAVVIGKGIAKTSYNVGKAAGKGESMRKQATHAIKGTADTLIKGAGAFYKSEKEKKPGLRAKLKDKLDKRKERRRIKKFGNNNTEEEQ